MMLIMTMTPVHMTAHGHHVETIGLVISGHTFGMFALAPTPGRLTDRFRQRPGHRGGARGPGRRRPSSRRSRHPMAARSFRRAVPPRLRLEHGLRRRQHDADPGRRLADRTRLQGLADSLIWSSAAAASLGSGSCWPRRATPRSRSSAWRLTIVPLWLFLHPAAAGLRRPPSYHAGRPARDRASASSRRPTRRGRGHNRRPPASEHARSALWAKRTSPGPKITVGVAPSLTSRRMSAPYGSPRSTGRRPSVASAASARDTSAADGRPGPVPTSPPPVSSTPTGCPKKRIRGAGRLDARAQVSLRVPPVCPSFTP